MAVIVVFANDTERQISGIHITARVIEKNGTYSRVLNPYKIREIKEKLESVLLEYFDNIDDESDYFSDKEFNQTLNTEINPPSIG